MSVTAGQIIRQKEKENQLKAQARKKILDKFPWLNWGKTWSPTGPGPNEKSAMLETLVEYEFKELLRKSNSSKPKPVIQEQNNSNLKEGDQMETNQVSLSEIAAQIKKENDAKELERKIRTIVDVYEKRQPVKQQPKQPDNVCELSPEQSYLIAFVQKGLLERKIEKLKYRKKELKAENKALRSEVEKLSDESNILRNELIAAGDENKYLRDKLAEAEKVIAELRAKPVKTGSGVLA